MTKTPTLADHVATIQTLIREKEMFDFNPDEKVLDLTPPSIEAFARQFDLFTEEELKWFVG